jgi:hypothetical protein
MVHNEYCKAKNSGDMARIETIRKKIADLNKDRGMQESFLSLMTIDDMSIQARSKISFKDIPMFQIKGLYVYDKNQRIFDTVGDFLNTFEKILTAENVNIDQDWCKWLNCSINQEHQVWFDRNLLNKHISWKEAKTIFEGRFESMVYKLLMGVKAVTMDMNPGESVITFGERLLKAMHEGEVDDCQALAYRFLGCLLFTWRSGLGIRIHQSVQ